MTDPKDTRGKVAKGSNRMPSDSLFYDKILPALLVALGVFMVLLILVAIGMLLGIF